MVRNMSDSHIFLKKEVPVAGVMSASPVPPMEVFARDGSHLRCGNQTRTHVSGGETGEAAGEIEPGWAGPLVPDECCGGKRSSLGLP